MEQFLKNRLFGIDAETLSKIERHLVQDDRFRDALKEAIESAVNEGMEFHPYWKGVKESIDVQMLKWSKNIGKKD
jgi:hypothetical protein